MNNTDKQRIRNIILRLDDAIDFIRKDRIFICTKTTITSLPKDSYTNEEKITITPITKFTGSNLAQLLNAREELSLMLQNKDLQIINKI